MAKEANPDMGSVCPDGLTAEVSTRHVIRLIGRNCRRRKLRSNRYAKKGRVVT
jgi:hypothetical protein